MTTCSTEQSSFNIVLFHLKWSDHETCNTIATLGNIADDGIIYDNDYFRKVTNQGSIYAVCHIPHMLWSYQWSRPINANFELSCSYTCLLILSIWPRISLRSESPSWNFLQNTSLILNNMSQWNIYYVKLLQMGFKQKWNMLYTGRSFWLRRKPSSYI